MCTEINYDKDTIMQKPFPVIRKTGAVSPYGEATPFVHNGRIYRLELADTSRGTDPQADSYAIIRDRETGRIISRFANGCYFHSLYEEGGTVYVTGVVSEAESKYGSRIRLFESRDLQSWTERDIISNPGWLYFNTSLTKGPDGYVLCIEAGAPREYVGEHPFTCFFATSKDLYNWTLMDYDKCFSKDRYMGGPWLRYSRGYYYLISVTELPCERYTNYIYRTADFSTWEVGLYNPMLMPGNEDRSISPYAHDLSREFIEVIKTGMITSNSDVDMCEYGDKTLISYIVGNQHGFYYLAEAEYDGSIADLLESYF